MANRGMRRRVGASGGKRKFGGGKSSGGGGSGGNIARWAPIDESWDAFEGVIHAIAEQSDGRIIVAGSKIDFPPSGQIAWAHRLQHFDTSHDKRQGGARTNDPFVAFFSWPRSPLS